MSIPLHCAACGEFVGTRNGRALLGNFDSRVNSPCPGRGKHAKPERTEQIHCGGLLRFVRKYYPETGTESSWDEYIGPPSLKLLKRAIVKGTRRRPNGSYDGATVNGKWAWYQRRGWFSGYLYGDGVEELKNQMQQQSA